jgi:hypothetical protein
LARVLIVLLVGLLALPSTASGAPPLPDGQLVIGLGERHIRYPAAAYPGADPVYFHKRTAATSMYSRPDMLGQFGNAAVGWGERIPAHSVGVHSHGPQPRALVEHMHSVASNSARYRTAWAIYTKACNGSLGSASVAQILSELNPGKTVVGFREGLLARTRMDGTFLKIRATVSAEGAALHGLYDGAMVPSRGILGVYRNGAYVTDIPHPERLFGPTTKFQQPDGSYIYGERGTRTPRAKYLGPKPSDGLSVDEIVEMERAAARARLAPASAARELGSHGLDSVGRASGSRAFTAARTGAAFGARFGLGFATGAFVGMPVTMLVADATGNELLGVAAGIAASAVIEATLETVLFRTPFALSLAGSLGIGAAILAGHVLQWSLMNYVNKPLAEAAAHGDKQAQADLEYIDTWSVGAYWNVPYWLRWYTPAPGWL